MISDVKSPVPPQGLPSHAKIVAAVNAALDEGAKVRDGASEDVRRTRGRCRTIEGRLRSLLKGFQGEVSEQVPAAPSTCRLSWHIPLIWGRGPVVGLFGF